MSVQAESILIQPDTGRVPLVPVCLGIKSGLQLAFSINNRSLSVNDSSNTTAPGKHHSDERGALPGGGLSAHYARKLAWHGADEAAQTEHGLDHRSPVPVGRPGGACHPR